MYAYKREQHRANRTGWLRAAVLGANAALFRQPASECCLGRLCDWMRSQSGKIRQPQGSQ